MIYLQIAVVLVIVLLIVYIFGYFTNPNEFMINQVSASDFQFSLLYERHPIVIEDPIVNSNDLLRNWFNMNRVNILSDARGGVWDKNRSKYLFIQSRKRAELMISRPQSRIIDGYPSDDILCIKLKPNQVAIIPFRWYVMFNTDHHTYHYIDDLITSLLRHMI